MDEILSLKFDEMDNPIKRAEYTEVEREACFRQSRFGMLTRVLMYEASRFQCPVESERIKLVTEAEELVRSAQLLIPGLWDSSLSLQGKRVEVGMKKMANMMSERKAFRE